MPGSLLVPILSSPPPPALLCVPPRTVMVPITKRSRFASWIFTSMSRYNDMVTGGSFSSTCCR